MVFFDSPAEQSLAKASIVAKYFERYSPIMAKRADRVGFFDLFSGPGRYETGEPSTPLLVLEWAVRTPRLRETLVSRFNDSNADFASRLSNEILALPGISTLRYRPEVTKHVVDDGLVSFFDQREHYPALTFMDPWGYKALSLKLLQSAIRGWGNEVIFFFNYSRFNAAIENGRVEEHVESLLAPEILGTLRLELPGADSKRRESLIMRALGESIQLLGTEHFIPFRFSRPDGRTSHYICFASKHPLGYLLMKEVMAEAGICDPDGVPRFEYIPRHAAIQLSFTTARPLESLPSALNESHSGETLTFKEIWETHQIGRPFTRANYRRAVLEMEGRGEVRVHRGSRARPGTLGDTAKVEFLRG